jgi:hypothetical protein
VRSSGGRAGHWHSATSSANDAKDFPHRPTAVRRGQPAGVISSLVLDEPRPVPGTSAELGESPVWDPRTGVLRWVDLRAGVPRQTDGATGAG